MSNRINRLSSQPTHPVSMARKHRFFFFIIGICALAAPAALIVIATGAPKLAALDQLGFEIYFIYLVVAFIFASGYFILAFLPQERADQKTLAIIAMVCLLLPFSVFGLFMLMVLPHAIISGHPFLMSIFTAILLMFISTAVASVVAYKVAFPSKPAKTGTK